MLSADRIHSFGDSSAGSAVRAYTKSRSSIRINTANSVLITREQSCPVHIAGSARRLARSLMQRRRRLISCVVCSVSMFTSPAYDLRPRMRLTRSTPFPQLSQEFVGRHKERILMKDSTDDDHRMSPHNVNNEICAKLGQIVSAYDRVDGPVLAKPYIVCSRFILQQPIHAWSIFQSPFHMSDKANQWKVLFFRVLHDRFEQSQRLVLIESAIAKVRISPGE